MSTKPLVFQPRRLLLIDCVGAIVSAILLGVVLVRWADLVGMPVGSLYFLAVFPVLFAVYDMVCLLKVKGSFATCLKVIALLNFSYCVISISILCLHWKQLTWIGRCYFVVELVIVVVLGRVQWTASTKKCAVED